MARHRIAALVALFLSYSGNAFAEGPFGDFYLGGWKVAAYTNDANRTFSHCAAAAQFESGIYFLVSVNIGMSWSLGFVESSWRLRKGETIPIDLTFDGRKKFHVYGDVMDPSAGSCAFPPCRMITQRT